MSVLTIGVGEWSVSNKVEDILKTYALGSCVAVVIYDRALRIAGMVHVALPESSMDPARAAALPGYFADSGVPVMIEEMKRLGAVKGNVWVKLAGGATIMDPQGFFDIGKRNILAVKRMLWRSSLGPIAEDTGGTMSRTVSVAVLDGGTSITSANRQWTI